MSVTARSIVVNVAANTAGYQRQMAAAGAATGKLTASAAAVPAATAGANRGVRNMAGGMGLLSPKILGPAGVVMALKASVSAAADFEESATKLQSQIGLTAQEADRLADASRRVGVETGIGAQQAVDASFFIASAGLRGADAMDALERSSQAARIGLGETATVADLVTSAMNAYGPETLSAAEATDILVGTVREGKAEAEELAGSMGQVLPIASELGVTFDQVGAAQAAMTRTGTGAATAATQLRAILVSLLDPAEGAEQAMSNFGLSSEQLRQTIREDGLFTALMDIRDAVGDNEQAMGQIFPNVRALSGVLDLTGANAADAAAIFESLTDTTGLLDEGVAAVEGTTRDATARMRAGFRDLAISIGDGSAPIIVGAINAINDAMNFGGPPSGGFTNEDGTSRAATREDFLSASTGDGFGGFLRDLTGANVAQGIDNLGVLVGAIDESNTAAGQQAEAYNRTRAALQQFDVDVRQAAMGQERMNGTASEADLSPLIGAYQDLASATDRSSDAIDRNIERTAAATSPMYGLRDAIGELEDATAELSEAEQKHGEDSDEARAATWRKIEAIERLEAEVLSGGASYDEFTAQLDRWVDMGALTRTEADRIAKEVRDLTGAAEEYAGDYWAYMHAQVDHERMRIANRLLNDLSKPRTVTLNVRPVQIAGTQSLGGFTERAGGGPVGPSHTGGWTIVGEEGPELVKFDQPGHVYTAAQSMQMVGASGGGSAPPAPGGPQAGTTVTVGPFYGATEDTVRQAAHQTRVAATRGAYG